MAKKPKVEANEMTNENQTDSPQATRSLEEIQAAAASDGGGRAIMFKVGDTMMKRADYCRKRWSEGVGRSQIAKECSELQGSKVLYQVVFQATKGLPGGPARAEAPVAASTSE